MPIKDRQARNKYIAEWKRKKRKEIPGYFYNSSPNEEQKEKLIVHRKRAKLKKDFNITLEYFHNLLDKQNGVCAICESPEVSTDYRTGKVRNLAVDHNHTTDKLRGLLCLNCNQGLGKFKDDIKLLEKAVDYLNRFD